MKTLLVFATPNENQFTSNSKDQDVLLTGIGKLNAAIQLSHTLHQKKFDRILNLGICGSVAAQFNIGDIISVYSVIEGDHDSFGESIQYFLPTLDPKLPKGILITQDRAIKTKSQKKHVLSLSGDVVDMEAFALAKVAKEFKISFYCLKVVSDHGKKNSSKTILKNLVPCSKKLCQHAASII